MSSAGAMNPSITKKKKSFYMKLGVYNTNQQGHLNGGFPVSISTP